MPAPAFPLISRDRPAPRRTSLPAPALVPLTADTAVLRSPLRPWSRSPPTPPSKLPRHTTPPRSVPPAVPSTPRPAACRRAVPPAVPSYPTPRRLPGRAEPPRSAEPHPVRSAAATALTRLTFLAIDISLKLYELASS